jgi:hypothetical protein
MYDLIIISQTSPSFIQMTQNCINSALADTKDVNVILVESGQSHLYDNVNTFVEYTGEFNYNRALNLGLQYVKGDIYILANNDLIFRPGWSKIGDLMRLNGYHSASAISKGSRYPAGEFLYEGYDIGSVLNGWCIFIDKYCLDKIGQLDETCLFWYSDNLYACQIKSAGIKHALFCNCQIDHITSQTLRKQDHQIQRQYQTGDVGKFKLRQTYYAEKERLCEVNSTHL